MESGKNKNEKSFSYFNCWGDQLLGLIIRMKRKIQQYETIDKNWIDNVLMESHY